MIRLMLILAIACQPLLMRPGSVSDPVHTMVGSIAVSTNAATCNAPIDGVALSSAQPCCATMDIAFSTPRPKSTEACCSTIEGTTPEQLRVQVEPMFPPSYAPCTCVLVPIDQRPTTPMPMHHAGSQSFSWLTIRPRPIALIVVPEPSALGQTSIVRADLRSLSHGLSQALRGIWHT